MGRARIGVALVVVAASAACDGGPSRLDGVGRSGAASGAGSSAGAGDDAWVGLCEQVLRDVPNLADGRRVLAVINACKPKGDWAPLLAWNTPAADGGPRTEVIEAALVATSAFCTNAAKQAFMGALVEARGKHTERPWRRLAEVCQGTLGAGADNRFASAPLFALDRIARAAAAQPRLAPLLAAIDLPLPPWSVSGAGVDLAPSPVTKPNGTRVAVTVTQTELYVGTLPRAKLGATGVTVLLGEAPYPGTAVAPDAVDARIGELTRSPITSDAHSTQYEEPIAIIAPSGLRATRVVDALLAISGWRTPVLAVAAPGAPAGWLLLGQSGLHLARKAHESSEWFALDGSGETLLNQVAKLEADRFAAYPAISVGDDATAAALATVIGALAYHDLGRVALAKRGTEQQRTQQRNGSR